MVKNLLAMQEKQFQSMGLEDPLEKEIASHFSIRTREIHGQRAWWATVHRVEKSWT